MIQRKQTIYLVIAVALSLICLCSPIGRFGGESLNTAMEYNLWLTNLATGQKFFSTWPLFAILVLSTALGVCSIFMYHNRKAQSGVCTFAMMLLVGWYLVYAVLSKLLGMGVFSPSWQAFLPALSIVLYFMSRKAIIADERLVRAADRIR